MPSQIASRTPSTETLDHSSTSFTRSGVTSGKICLQCRMLLATCLQAGCFQWQLTGKQPGRCMMFKSFEVLAQKEVPELLAAMRIPMLLFPYMLPMAMAAMIVRSLLFWPAVNIFNVRGATSRRKARPKSSKGFHRPPRAIDDFHIFTKSISLFFCWDGIILSLLGLEWWSTTAVSKSCLHVESSFPFCPVGCKIIMR